MTSQNETKDVSDSFFLCEIKGKATVVARTLTEATEYVYKHVSGKVKVLEPRLNEFLYEVWADGLLVGSIEMVKEIRG